MTFPQIMHNNGYQTAMFGKLHFGNNPKGFDQFKILPGQGNYYNPDFITKHEGNIRLEGYTTDIITDMTIDWLDKDRDAEKPFLLMYLHKAPHREWLPAKRHYEKFTQMTFPEPETLFDTYEGNVLPSLLALNVKRPDLSLRYPYPSPASLQTLFKLSRIRLYTRFVFVCYPDEFFDHFGVLFIQIVLFRRIVFQIE